MVVSVISGYIVASTYSYDVFAQALLKNTDQKCQI